MTFKLNWKFKKALLINHVKLYASLLIVCISFNFTTKAQLSTIFLEEDTLSIYYGQLIFEQGTLFSEEDILFSEYDGMLGFYNGAVNFDWQTIFQEDTVSFEGNTLHFGENSFQFNRGTLFFEGDSLVFDPDTLVLEPDTLVLEPDTLIIKPDTIDTGDHSVLGTIDTIVAKTNKITIDNEVLPVYSISVGRVGTVFPCGNRFGISLQAPGYHIFSAESAYNATFIPNSNEIDWPDDGSQKNSSQDNLMTYESSFNRIKSLDVGMIEGSFGKRWTLSAEQFKQNYSNLFDFAWDGEMRAAGDYNNMFFEMLISIQELAKENDELKSKLSNMEDRLTALEAKMNIDRTNFIEESIANLVEISPNPASTKILSIDYSINPNVQKAILFIYDINGKTLYKINLKEREEGRVTQFFDLTTGVYFYQLITDGHKGDSQKLIIN